MNPIVYHNILAALVEGQKSIIQDYEQRLAQAITRAENAERELEALRSSIATNGAVSAEH